jgi:tetratricopeptide (TPR) repeat protein
VKGAVPPRLPRWAKAAFRPVWLWAATKKLRETLDRYHAGDYAAACTACEAALKIYPAYAEASYVLGLLTCIGGAPELGARWFTHALSEAPHNPAYIAALADAMLLGQREQEALSLYERAFPQLAAENAGVNEAGAPWKRAHPDWLQQSKRVTLPGVPYDDSEVATGGTLAAKTATHLVNWAGLLVRRRQVGQAIYLIERAVKANPALGYAHALLALLYTLNRDWKRALASAMAARHMTAEVFPGSTDLCLVSSQLGLRYSFGELDPVFDWSAFTGVRDESESSGELPQCMGNIRPRFARDSLVYLICCDTDYFMTHAIGLACSIRTHDSTAAIHLHVFNPHVEVWEEIQRLKTALSPLPLTVSWEYLDFERYGGKAVYCVCARFQRLYQLVCQVDNRIAMVDADSLLRGEVSTALPQEIRIGVVRAPDEPIWHQYLGGFTTFRRSVASLRFLTDFSAFMVRNLIAGRARIYLDQIGLYATVYKHATMAHEITELAVQKFCDTLCKDEGLVWSVTQRKDDEHYTAYKQAMLARYGYL